MEGRNADGPPRARAVAAKWLPVQSNLLPDMHGTNARQSPKSQHQRSSSSLATAPPSLKGHGPRYCRSSGRSQRHRRKQRYTSVSI
uniref:Uncharacterized protein n=1 Tax=Oryza punctata TaxID=4537 RepID=A0A0E0JE22_ORYPU